MGLRGAPADEGFGAAAIFGTTEAPPERREVRAGPVSAVFEASALRDIRFHGVEAVRAIAFLVRDASWGTLPVAVKDIAIETDAEATVLRFAATAGPLAYDAVVAIDASSCLDFSIEAIPSADLVTNRTGFVVLHPAELAGETLVVGHTDGRVSETRFPERVSPTQPAFDIASLAHPLPGGGRCEIHLSGDAYEMEDQRNWSDASFKTYIRPLARPRPYLLPAGATFRQQVTLDLSGRPSVAASSAAGPAQGRLPELALFVEPRDLAGAAAAASGIGPAGALVLRAGPVPLEASAVEQAATIARRLDARLEVEVAAALRDPEAEAAAIVRAIDGLEVAALRIGPARDLVSHGPGAWPEHERPLGELLAALRRAGAAGKIGAGTPSFFPEFNRNPPPPGADFAYFGLAANVHAADDRSVAETLSVHPAIIESARHLCPRVPVRLGPVTIGMPHTPYGSGPAPNPGRRRIPAARVDPRRRVCGRLRSGRGRAGEQGGRRVPLPCCAGG